MARRDRPALSGSTGDGHTGREAVAAVWRIESARIVGALARYTGDIALAEDLAQEALAEALVTWPRDGVPRNPAGWLLTVGRRRAIDAFRRRSALDERYAALAHDLGEGGVVSGSTPADPARDAEDVLWDPDQIDDDVLALMFISCHPVLSREARVALTLRVVGGLTSDEIAKAFLVPTATVAVAPSVDATNWERVVLIYEALGRLAPSPVVDLNRAVAVSMAEGPAAALPIVDELVAAEALSNSHLLPSVRGELLTRLGRTDEARTELELAVRLCGNERERAVLERKLADLG